MTAISWNQKTIDEFHARNGRGIGHFGDKLLLMTAKGAKSGDSITTPLVHRRVGDDYVVVASKGGAPENPKWYGNIRANPVVELEVAADSGTQRLQARARPVPSSEEHDRLYALMVELWPDFAEYQKKTSRTIPIVVLHPVR